MADNRIKKIRAEIIRRIDVINNRENKIPADKATLVQLTKLLSFIDSMQKEPVSEDLEEAARRYAALQAGMKDAMTSEYYEEYPYSPNDIEAFKAGAQWQKQNDEKALNENALLYNARLEGIEIGKAEMKQQMMKDALDSTIVDDGLYKSIVPTMQTMLRYNKGDKVKIIIIKEE